MQGYDKKCESSQKRLVECKLFEKCKGAKEQQLVECNLFNHLPATSCQSSHNQLGGGGVLKVQPAYSFRLNSHSEPAFSCLAALLTPSPPKITRLLFACMQKDIWLCKPLFQFSSFHRACSKFVHLRFELKVENILSDILRNIEKLTITHGRQYLIISQNSVKLPKSARCSSAFSIKIIADEVVSILWERVL